MTPRPLRSIPPLFAAWVLAGAVAGCVGARAESPKTETAQAKPAATTDLNARFMTSDPEELSFLESEGREVYVHRAQVVKALDISPGARVADVGAGTGAYLDVLAEAVGPQGRLYAVDVAPKLVEHLRARAEAKGLRQVKAVLADQSSIGIGAAELDLVFTSDTYHHFEDPSATNASILKALKPGGRYVVLDFERDPKRSRPWILEHVRAGKETVTREVVAAGFELEREIDVEELEENYLLVFRAP